ncbi:DUF2062 domain-containing protein [Paracoccaceae bacterium GXU_MW_L88]
MFKRRERPPFYRRLIETVYPRAGWRRTATYMGHRVRRLPDTPHRIALGFSCGAFASFSPLFGFHFFYAMFWAWVLRGNIIAAAIGTIVGNPITFPFIATMSFKVGKMLTGGSHHEVGEDVDSIYESFSAAFGSLWDAITALFGGGHADWDPFFSFVSNVFWPYFLGGVILGVIASVACYFVAKPAIAAYQKRRRAAVERKWAERLARAKESAKEGGSDV